METSVLTKGVLDDDGDVNTPSPTPTASPATWLSSTAGHPPRRESITAWAFDRVRSIIGRRRKSITGASRRFSLTGGTDSMPIARDSRGEGILKLKSDGDLNCRGLCTSFRSGARSLKGRKDEKRANEDAFVAIDDLFSLVLGRAPSGVRNVGLLGVFDGHGGGRCSSFIRDHLPHAIANSPAWSRLGGQASASSGICGQGDGPAPGRSSPVLACDESEAKSRQERLGVALDEAMKEAIQDGFRSTQEAFLRRARDNGDKSGSTAVIALICGDHVTVANLGDSGALFYNNDALPGRGTQITIRTKNHTFDNLDEKERVEAAGGTFTDGRLFGRLHPTRSFGDRDIQSLKDGVLVAVPEIAEHRLKPSNGAAFLVLGSDGLWDNVPDRKVIEIVRAEYRRQEKKKTALIPKAPRIARNLVTAGLKGVNGDDVTAVVILFDKRGPQK